jgi:hypothetical protein
MSHQKCNEIETLLAIYKEYLVDIAIDEYSVHQCGSSIQSLSLPSAKLRDLLLGKEKTFIADIWKLVAHEDEEPAVKQALELRMNRYENTVNPNIFKTFIALYKEQSITIPSTKLNTNDELIELYIRRLAFTGLRRHQPLKNHEQQPLPDTM